MLLREIIRHKRAAQKLLDHLLKLTDETKIAEISGKRGGVLCVGRPDGCPKLCVTIGAPAKEQEYRFVNNAIEKCCRLGSNTKLASSRVSANEDFGRYAGAILGDTWIYSFSGFPQDMDEVYSLALAAMLEDISSDNAMRIAGMRILNKSGEYRANIYADLLYHELLVFADQQKKGAKILTKKR